MTGIGRGRLLQLRRGIPLSHSSGVQLNVQFNLGIVISHYGIDVVGVLILFSDL